MRLTITKQVKLPLLAFMILWVSVLHAGIPLRGMNTGLAPLKKQSSSSGVLDEGSTFNYVPVEGDYRTGQASSGFNSANNFEVYQGGAWVTASAAIGLNRTVLIRDGHEGLLTGSGTRNVKKLIVGEGHGAVLSASINNGSVSAINIIQAGRLNSIPPLYFVNGAQANGSTNAEAVISAVNVTGADIKNPGSGYTTANVSFSGGGGSGAAATAVVVSGKIVEIAITNSGSGYTSIPAMNITGDGTGAIVSAKVGVTAVTISNGGTGYTVTPLIISGTNITIRHGATLNIAEDVSFQRGSSAYTGYGSGSHTGNLAIGTGLTAEGDVNFISYTIVPASGTYVGSSMTVKFPKANTTVPISGSNFRFRNIDIGATTTVKVSNATVMNIAETITLNSTGKIDATEGTIGFVTPLSETNPRTIVNGTFKDGIVNKMIVNSTKGVTLTQNIKINELNMQKGLLNLPATIQLTVSKVSGGNSNSYINTESETSGAIAKVILKGINTQSNVPLGNGGNYLPVRITPQTASDFRLSVHTGLTNNGLPNGSVVTDKSKFVDAAYHITRTSGTGNFTIRVGFPQSLKGSGFITPLGVNFGVSGYNGTNWGVATGNGDNVQNIATVTFNTNSQGIYRVEKQGVFFAHPGILHNADNLEQIIQAANSGNQPWKKGYEMLKKKYTGTYNQLEGVAYADVYRAQGVNSPSAMEMTRAAATAYRSAMLWVITGDIAYANIAKNILNSWSSTLQTFSGGDAKLCAAWYGFAMVNAAEILRYTNSGWSQGDIQQAELMFRNVIYPVIENFQRGWAGNWDTAITKCIMGIGVFLNDETIFNKGVNFLSSTTDNANGTLKNYIYENGQCWESGRDQTHVQMGLGGLAEACEIGEKQGFDLYGLFNNKLLKGYEYAAKYNLGYNDVPYTPNHYGTVISEEARGEFLAGYEMVYNHYFNRKMVPVNEIFYTKRVVDRIRSVEGGEAGTTLQLGFGTLLYNESTVIDESSAFNYIPLEGDYRTVQATSSFGSPSQFEVYQGGVWVAASAAIGLNRTVLIRDGHIGSAAGTGTRNVKKLIVGEGHGAVLSATISGGSISAINIVEPGRLNSIPSLIFVNGAQSNGSTTAEAGITSVNVTGADIKNSGSGYTTASVSFSGGGGSGAAATAVIVDGKIMAITVTNSGSGYTSIPIMTITGDGTGAAVSAKVGIVNITINNGGTGYTVAPKIIAGTFLVVANGYNLNVAEDASFQRGSSVRTGFASGPQTSIFTIGTDLKAEEDLNFISSTISSSGNYVSSSMTVKFPSTNTISVVSGPNFTFKALEIGSSTTLKIEDMAVMNVAEAITLNSTGVIDATKGTIGFVNTSPFTSIARTITDNTFKNANINKMIVNSNAGVTLSQNLGINELDMQSGLLNIPESGQLQVSKVLGGNSNSYINTESETSGEIAKVILTGLNAQTDVPLGNGGNYLPVRVTPQSASNFKMSVLTGLTDNGLPNGGVVADKSQFVNAAYHVTRTSGTGDFTINAGFPASLKGNGFSNPSGVHFGIAGHDGSNWGATTGNGDNVQNMATATFNTNSEGIYRVEIYETLPLNFVNVAVKVKDNFKRAEVSWTTLNESGVQGFEIQKSTNGKTFQAIGTMKSEGSQSCKFIDKDLLSGVSYYRIKSIEANGNDTEYSQIVPLSVEFNQNSIEIYPNPVKGSIVNVRLTEVLSSNISEVRFTLYDINGRKINIEKDVTGMGIYKILLPEALNDGVYQLIIEKNGAIASKSIIVQKGSNYN